MAVERLSGANATGGDAGERPAAGARLGFAARLALFYAAMFLIYGIQVPFLPVWLDWRGLTAAEIGIASSAPYFIRCIVTPAVGVVADRTGRHRQLIIVSAAITLIAVLALAVVPGTWPVIALTTLTALAAASMVPLTETVALEGVRHAGHDYGRMRLWGSLTFIVASFIGGWTIGRLGAGAGVWLLAGGAVATLAAAFLLPKPEGREPADGAASGAASGTAGGAKRSGDVMRLVRTPLFLVFLVAAGATQASHALFYTFGALHLKGQGLAPSTIGILWAIGVVAEVALFHYSGAFVGRLGVARVLTLGGIACVVRWTVLSLDPGLWVLVPLQVLHAATYAATHLGAMHFIARAVPRAAAGTAQGFYSTVAAGIGMGGATLAASVLYPRFGGQAYLAMAALSAVGLAAAVYLERRWGGGALTPERGSARPAEAAAPTT